MDTLQTTQFKVRDFTDRIYMDGTTPEGNVVSYRWVQGDVVIRYTIVDMAHVPSHDRVLKDVGDFADALPNDARQATNEVEIYFNHTKVGPRDLDLFEAYAARLLAWVDRKGFSRDVINVNSVLADLEDGLLPEEVK